ncbi:MAG TPA: anthranilate phosphoribosyltransferase [Actinomycetes bacterium]|nr:anthranilate phosphoribosyltransferase [Actinomycetes bacterium]
MGDVDRTWPGLLAALIGGEDLSSDDTAWAMAQILAGEITDVALAGFLVALRAKGETVDEMAGLVAAMLDAAVRIEVPGRVVDVVGTGGDRARTVNISTMASVVVAAAGERVVKHGNRAASSACGSADLLEALGVSLDLDPQAVAAVAGDAGITFCFAQRFHPAMRHASTTRSGLGVATAFNFLGPLTNPAGPRVHAIGVADLRMAPIMAGVLADRGSSALVFRGEDGIDELTVTAPSTVWVVRAGAVVPDRLDPRDLGIELVDAQALRGADATFNAAVARRIFAGETGPVRDAVLLNAAAALVAAAADGSTVPATPGGVVEEVRAALPRAAEAIDSGAAAATLHRWVEASRRLESTP